MAVATGEQSCTILHYEQYVLPQWAVPLKPLIVWYLQWSMQKELHDLRAIILERAAKDMTQSKVLEQTSTLVPKSGPPG